MATTVCATRSPIVGTPSRRTPEPCGLGISTALTGGGEYEPELVRFEILWMLSARSASNASRSCPSTPAAPLLALTRRHASQTIGLGIANGLSLVFGMFARFLPRPRSRLFDRTFRISRPLGSTATPASSGFTATTGRSAGERRVGTQCLRVRPVGRLPLATLKAYNPGRHIDARLLTFRARAADQAHTASTPGTAWPIIGTPARLITGEQPDPPLSMPPRLR